MFTRGWVKIWRSPDPPSLSAWSLELPTLPTWCKRSKIRPKKDAWKSQNGWSMGGSFLLVRQQPGFLCVTRRTSENIWDFYGFLHIFHGKNTPFLGGEKSPCSVTNSSFVSVETAENQGSCSQSCTTFSKKTLEMEVNKARSLRQPPSWPMMDPWDFLPPEKWKNVLKKSGKRFLVLQDGAPKIAFSCPISVANKMVGITN